MKRRSLSCRSRLCCLLSVAALPLACGGGAAGDDPGYERASAAASGAQVPGGGSGREIMKPPPRPSLADLLAPHIDLGCAFDGNAAGASLHAAASVSGRLDFTGRIAQGFSTVTGTLRIETHADGRAAVVYPAVQVQGAVSPADQPALWLDVLSGAADLQSLYVYVGARPIPAGLLEERVSGTGLDFRTTCPATGFQPLPGPDLVVSELRFEGLGLEIFVFNGGYDPADLSAISRVSVNGNLQTGVAPVDPVSGSVVAALAPGKQASIKLPISVLGPRCSDAVVRIDADHLWQQAPSFDPFANDTYITSTPCLHWTSPLGPTTMGMTRAQWDALVPAHTKYTPPTPLLIEGHSLQDIVSSLTVARADGGSCNGCHYPTTPEPTVYRPPGGLLDSQFPYVVSWDGLSGVSGDPMGRGWARRFIEHDVRTMPTTNPRGNKPPHLVEFFKMWLADGAQY